MSLNKFRKWLLSITVLYMVLSLTHLYGIWFDIFGYVFMLIILMFTFIAE